jgi:hypothetical protein
MRISTKADVRVCGVVLSVAMASLPLVAADKDPLPAPAPIPPQILAAKKVFLSNSGANGMAFAILDRAGDTGQHFNQLYTAVKSSGRFEIVGAPSDADLVFELRFDSPSAACAPGRQGILAPNPRPMLALTILDGKTHFTLWTIDEAVECAVLGKTWENNIAAGVEHLVRDLMSLAGQPAAAGAKQ